MNADSDFGDDVDEDASPLDGKDRGLGADEIEQLAESEHHNAMTASAGSPQSSMSTPVEPRVATSPRASRLSDNKPVSPEALKVSAGLSGDDVVEVFEEN